MALRDGRLSVCRVNLRAWFENGEAGAEPLGPALVADITLIEHEIDDRMRGVRIHLGRIGADEVHHIAGEVHRHRLQSETEPEARHPLLPGESGCGNLAFESPFAVAARNDDAVEIGQPSGGQQTLHLLGLDPLDVDLGPVMESGMLDALDHRKVGIR